MEKLKTSVRTATNKLSNNPPPDTPRPKKKPRHSMRDDSTFLSIDATGGANTSVLHTHVAPLLLSLPSSNATGAGERDSFSAPEWSLKVLPAPPVPPYSTHVAAHGTNRKAALASATKRALSPAELSEVARYTTTTLLLEGGKSILPDSFEIQPRLRWQTSVAYTYGILGKHKESKASEEEEKGTEEKYSWFCMCTEKCRQKARSGAGISVVKTERGEQNMSNPLKHLRDVHHIRSAKRNLDKK